MNVSYETAQIGQEKKLFSVRVLNVFPSTYILYIHQVLRLVTCI